MTRPSGNKFLQALPLLVLMLLGGHLLARRADHPPSVSTPVAPEEAIDTDESPDALRVATSGSDFSLTPDRDAGLFAQLSAGDRAWIPRAEPIPGGGTRYFYKKHADQPPLTVDQIRALMLNPPTFETEQRTIRSLLDTLRVSGVAIILGPPRKQGAAGEWEPGKATLRIRPDIPAKGSREFVRVLNHEAIHVAQSCSNGTLKARPQPLGLPRNLNQQAMRHLNEAIYSKVSVAERVLEEEAYANQERLGLGTQLVASHCRSKISS